MVSFLGDCDIPTMQILDTGQFRVRGGQKTHFCQKLSFARAADVTADYSLGTICVLIFCRFPIAQKR